MNILVGRLSLPKFGAESSLLLVAGGLIGSGRQASEEASRRMHGTEVDDDQANRCASSGSGRSQTQGKTDETALPSAPSARGFRYVGTGSRGMVAVQGHPQSRRLPRRHTSPGASPAPPEDRRREKGTRGWEGIGAGKGEQLTLVSSPRPRLPISHPRADRASWSLSAAGTPISLREPAGNLDRQF
jgi:hypothetical protein